MHGYSETKRQKDAEVVSTLTATISAYPNEPPRNVVTDLFKPCNEQKHC